VAVLKSVSFLFGPVVGQANDSLLKMRKIVRVIIVFVFLLAGFLLAARLLVGGGEDTWICVEGEWVKHGVPSAPMPKKHCST